MIDTLDGTNTQYELNYKKSTVARNILADKPPALPKMDYVRKVNVCDFNKKKNSLAVASLNCFFIYSMWIKKYCIICTKIKIIVLYLLYIID